MLSEKQKYEMHKKFKVGEKMTPEKKAELNKQMFTMRTQKPDNERFSTTMEEWPTVCDVGFACWSLGFGFVWPKNEFKDA